MPPGEFRLSAGNLVFNAVSPASSRIFRELHEIHRLSAFEFGMVEEPIPPPRPSRLDLSLFETQAVGLLKRMVHSGENRPRRPARRTALTDRNEVRSWFWKLRRAARISPCVTHLARRDERSG